MASINMVMIMGNCGRDPEARYTASGDMVVNVSIATSRFFKKGGERQEETEWHKVVAFGKTAEVVNEYVKKGDPLFVQGRIQTRSWTDKNGETRYTTEIVADQVQLMGRGKKQDDDDDDDRPRREQRREKPVPIPKQPSIEDLEDDIPF